MKISITAKDGSKHSFDCQPQEGKTPEDIKKLIESEGVTIRLRLQPSDIESVVVE